MVGFARNELLVVLAILALIWGLALVNFRAARVAARDVQRKNDLKHTATGLRQYFEQYDQFPPAVDGKILGCGSIQSPQPCEWGEDTLLGTESRLPEDPLAPPKSYTYLYFSNTRQFQLFASLESHKDPEYNQKVAGRKLACGPALPAVCNFGVSDGAGTPVDKGL